MVSLVGQEKKFGILILALVSMFIQTAGANATNSNKLFFEKEVATELFFIEVNTDPQKAVGEVGAAPLAHDYTALLQAGGWKQAAETYKDPLVSCMLYEQKGGEEITLGCGSINGNKGTLVILRGYADIDKYINLLINTMIYEVVKMMTDEISPEHSPPPLKEPWKGSFFIPPKNKLKPLWIQHKMPNVVDAYKNLTGKERMIGCG